MASLSQSGLPLEEALLAVSQQIDQPRTKSILLGVRSKVMEGHTLADGLTEFPQAFPELYRATIAAGESSGHLDVVLERLADYTEARQELRQRITNAMIYPAALVVMALACVTTAACTTVDDVGASDATPTAAIASTSTTSPPTAPADPSTTSTSIPIDAAGLLQSALAAYGPGYAFTASATVAGQEAAAISGFVIGDGSQMTVSSGDGIADYVTTPDVAWIRVDGGDWQELEASGPFEPPLTSLASPTSIAVVAADGGDVSLVATYPGQTFGLAADVEMRLRVVEGLLVEAGYSAGDAGVTTVFAPLTDQVLEIPSGNA
jgi:hypothetical protein